MQLDGHIDRESRIPIYKQIAARLRTVVRDKKRDRDEPIPTEKELSGIFQVQRATVRRALDELLSEGLIYRIRGKGTFVADLEPSVGGKRIEVLAAAGMIESGANPFSWFLYYDFIRGATDEAHAMGCHCRLLDAACPAEYLPDFLKHFDPDKCLGVMLLGYPGNEATVDRLRRNAIPYVVTDGLKKDLDINRVFTDRERGIGMAVDHLVGLGHRRIALLNGPLTDSYFQGRYNGYARALSLNGIPFDDELVVTCGGYSEEGRAAAKELIVRRPDLTGLVVSTDLRAVGVMAAVRELGLEVPGDISITSYHDSQAALAQTPQLTSVTLPAYEMGKLSARCLEALASPGARPPIYREARAELVVRGSTSNVRAEDVTPRDPAGLA